MLNLAKLWAAMELAFFRTSCILLHVNEFVYIKCLVITTRASILCTGDISPKFRVGNAYDLVPFYQNTNGLSILEPKNAAI